MKKWLPLHSKHVVNSQTVMQDTSLKLRIKLVARQDIHQLLHFASHHNFKIAIQVKETMQIYKNGPEIQNPVFEANEQV